MRGGVACERARECQRKQKRDASQKRRRHLTAKGSIREISQPVDFLDCGVDKVQVNPYTPLVRGAFLLDRGAYSSLTIDTMCQNPFVPFALFERKWFE